MKGPMMNKEDLENFIVFCMHYRSKVALYLASRVSSKRVIRAFTNVVFILCYVMEIHKRPQVEQRRRLFKLVDDLFDKMTHSKDVSKEPSLSPEDSAILALVMDAVEGS